MIIGSFLADRGVRQNIPVSFYFEKSVHGLAGMFGAVYAGGFYSLLDVRQPQSRLCAILDVLKPKCILCDQEHFDKAEELFDGYDIYLIEEILSSATINQEILKQRRNASLDIDPLYVNFTSGSTGTPKGVAVCHRSVIDFIPTFANTFGIQETDILGNQAPFDFDVSVKDIYSGIYTGACVQMIPRSYFSNPTRLMDLLCDRHVTVIIWAVSAMCFVSIMNGFGYRCPDEIRMIMFSGETMPVKQLKVWQKYLPDAVYVNLYGPTEITCNCTYHILDRSDR